MKKILLILLAIVAIKSYAQNNAEYGLFGGVGWYIGELNPDKLFYSPSPAFGFVYRYNLNKRYAVKFDVTHTTLNYADSKSKDPFRKARNYSFTNNINDISLQFEFNFLEYDSRDYFQYFTPYTTLGVCMIIAPSPQSQFQIGIPVGIGFKYQVNKNLCIGTEWNMRKTFTDYIDKLPDDVYVASSPDLENKQRSFLFNKDWYSFAGLFITYSFKRKVYDCPAYRY